MKRAYFMISISQWQQVKTCDFTTSSVSQIRQILIIYCLLYHLLLVNLTERDKTRCASFISLSRRSPHTNTSHSAAAHCSRKKTSAAFSATDVFFQLFLCWHCSMRVLLISIQQQPEKYACEIDNRECDPACAEISGFIHNSSNNHRRQNRSHLEYAVLNSHCGSRKPGRSILCHKCIQMRIRQISQETV